MKKLFLLSMFFCLVVYGIPEIIESHESGSVRREKEQESKEKVNEYESQNLGRIQQETEAARVLFEYKTELPKLVVTSEKATLQVKLPVTSESAKLQTSVAIKTTEPSKQVVIPVAVKQQTLGDWVKEWQKFIANPGKVASRLGFQTGELYRLPVSARAQALLKFVHEIPDGFFAEPTKALELLNGVLKEAGSALEHSSDKIEQLKAIKEAIANRAIQVVENGTFGKTPAESLNALKLSIVGNTIGVYAKLYPDAIPQLEAAALRKSLSIVAESPIDSKVQIANQLKVLFDAFNKNLVEAPEDLKTPEFMARADKVIAQKAAEALLKEPLRGNTTQLQFQNFLGDYSAIKKLVPTGVAQETLIEVFEKRLNSLANSTQDTLKMAQNFMTAASNKLKFLSPQEQTFIIGAINSLLLRPNLKEYATSLNSIVKKYNEELSVIGKYIELLTRNKFDQEASNLPAARRAILLYEFLQQHEVLLPENEKPRWERLRDVIKSFWSAAKGPLDIADRDPEFWEKYRTIKD